MSSTLQSRYAGHCELCKQTEPQVKVSECSKCRLVSYCSADHQKQCWKRHKTACKAYSKLRAEGVLRTPDDTSTFSSLNEWNKYRHRCLSELQRAASEGNPDFSSYMDPILHPRHCATCFKTSLDSSAVRCQKCGLAWWCSKEHSKAGRTSHEASCALLKLTKDCDKVWAHDEFPPAYTPKGAVPPAASKKMPKDWASYRSLRSVPKYDAATWAVVSNTLSVPVTVVYAMQQARVIAKASESGMDTVVLHVIGAASYPELFNPPKYEEILHWLPESVQQLRIIFIGPEASEEMAPSYQHAASGGRQLKFDIFNGKYHDAYVANRLEKPDLCIVFNSGIHHETAGPLPFLVEDGRPSESDPVQPTAGTWGETLIFLRDLDVPVFFTSYTLDELKQDTARLDAVGSKFIVDPHENPWKGLQPYREAFSLGFYFQNCGIVGICGKK